MISERFFRLVPRCAKPWTSIGGAWFVRWALPLRAHSLPPGTPDISREPRDAFNAPVRVSRKHEPRIRARQLISLCNAVLFSLLREFLTSAIGTRRIYGFWFVPIVFFPVVDASLVRHDKPCGDQHRVLTSVVSAFSWSGATCSCFPHIYRKVGSIRMYPIFWTCKQIWTQQYLRVLDRNEFMTLKCKPRRIMTFWVPDRK